MIARGQAGAAAELLVTADLIRKGSIVFRCLSPHAPFDLISVDGEVMTRIEVRTVVARKDGTLCPQLKERDVCDLYAFVCGDRIEYMLPEDARKDRRQLRLGGDWRDLGLTNPG